jgi:hypothetical protein
MFLSKKHLILHTITSDEKLWSKGILIDPKAGTATASDGKRLVELSLPKVDQFPVKDLALIDAGREPFLLPAEDARQIIQALPEGKNSTDPARYAAVTCGKGGKVSLVTSKHDKTSTHPVDPIDAAFPDYRKADVFPNGKPAASIVMDGALLRSTLGAVAVDEFNAVTMYVFKDRIVLGAIGKDGTHARAIQLALVKEPAPYGSALDRPQAVTPEKAAPESKSVVQNASVLAPKEAAKPQVARALPAPQPEPEVEETPDGPAEGTPNANGRHFYGKRRFSGKKRTFDASTVNPETPASMGQRAFLTFLVRSRGQSLTDSDFGSVSMKSAIERIESLKKSKNVDESFATYPQWKKLFFLLVEDQKVGPEKACAVLQGLTSISSTTQVIDEVLKKAPAEKASAAA